MYAWKDLDVGTYLPIVIVSFYHYLFFSTVGAPTAPAPILFFCEREKFETNKIKTGFFKIRNSLQGGGVYKNKNHVLYRRWYIGTYLHTKIHMCAYYYVPTWKRRLK